jgi:hypothetical protein
LYIQVTNLEKPYQITLQNMLGQVVYSSDQQWQETAMMERGAWSAGIYALVVTDAAGRRVGAKVVLE